MTVAIVPYRPDHAAAWRWLNEDWLVAGGYALEAKDQWVLTDPQGVVLDKGGHIFIGWRRLEACEAAARATGASRLYLETNAAQTHAIALYRRFGFVDLPPQPTPYARCDVWMEKRL